ncbi:alpha/beta hydrolase [uncultured Sphingomonas sp.]|uniref:alpha/beta fold hydrolase n=1 Tax=uncultured Sphingomonas sp. TaxID=158754 RepID=UPI0026183F33|nr:alpha/beta hydrolase [uncultured Sphingomonas sp.]
MDRIVIEANGQHFDALACGPRDGELLLCLHGFPQFADAWLPILESFAAHGYRAVAFDQRGYSPGARALKRAAYTMPHLVADVIAVADALGVHRFHLVGHDWGGAVGWAVAGGYADRLKTLTILSTPHPSALAAAIRSDPDQQARSAYMLMFRAAPGIAETYLLADDAAQLRAAYRGKVAPTQVEAIVGRLREDGALTAALNWYRAMGDNSLVGQIIVPTLFAWGDEDQALGRTAALATARFVDGPYRFEIVEGGSHWLIDERPEQIIALLAPHLQTPR